MLKKSILPLSVAAALLLACGASLAQSTPGGAAASSTTNIAVSATVSQACSISTTAALAFGAYDPTGTNANVALNATGQVSVSCSKGSTGLTIGMNNGTHAVGAQRQMQGATAADLLKYDLFQPPSNVPSTACTFPGVTAWNATGAGLLALSSATTKVARLYNVCGSIPGGQDVSMGAYTDTVIATLNF
jgi:spore coat protein U-like protein